MIELEFRNISLLQQERDISENMSTHNFVLMVNFFCILESFHIGCSQIYDMTSSFLKNVRSRNVARVNFGFADHNLIPYNIQM